LVWPGFLYKHHYEKNNGNTAGHAEMLLRHVRPLPRGKLSVFPLTSDISLSEIPLLFNHNTFTDFKDIKIPDREKLHFNTFDRTQTVQTEIFLFKSSRLAKDKSYKTDRSFNGLTEISHENFHARKKSSKHLTRCTGILLSCSCS
jgi:hypothetical protein